MANLIVRNVDDAIANALKVQASKHGISAEAEHWSILAQALLRPKKKPFLAAIPNSRLKSTVIRSLSLVY